LFRPAEVEPLAGREAESPARSRSLTLVHDEALPPISLPPLWQGRMERLLRCRQSGVDRSYHSMQVFEFLFRVVGMSLKFL